MKVWELEEGKEYVSKSNTRFKVNCGILKYYDEYCTSWCLSRLEYNKVMDMDFYEYIPPTDWSKVEVDTKVLCTENGQHWIKRYFAKYDINSKKCYVWDNGATSWSANARMSPWREVKLYKEE